MDNLKAFQQRLDSIDIQCKISDLGVQIGLNLADKIYATMTAQQQRQAIQMMNKHNASSPDLPQIHVVERDHHPVITYDYNPGWLGRLVHATHMESK